MCLCQATEDPSAWLCWRASSEPAGRAGSAIPGGSVCPGSCSKCCQKSLDAKHLVKDSNLHDFIDQRKCLRMVSDNQAPFSLNERDTESFSGFFFFWNQTKPFSSPHVAAVLICGSYPSRRGVVWPRPVLHCLSHQLQGAGEYGEAGGPLLLMRQKNKKGDLKTFNQEQVLRRWTSLH